MLPFISCMFFFYNIYDIHHSKNSDSFRECSQHNIWGNLKIKLLDTSFWPMLASKPEQYRGRFLTKNSLLDCDFAVIPMFQGWRIFFLFLFFQIKFSINVFLLLVINIGGLELLRKPLSSWRAICEYPLLNYGGDAMLIVNNCLFFPKKHQKIESFEEPIPFHLEGPG